MDFDPSQFLSMNMREDGQEISLDTGPYKKSEPTNENEVMEKFVVTGGLQLEPVELPVPRFDTLFGSVQEMIENNYGPMDANNDQSIRVMVPDGNGDDSGLSPVVGNESPVERTNSPADRIRKSVSYDEQRFRRDVFCGAYEKVKLFRLHCTSCDRHLGCAPQFTMHNMRAHKLLCVAVCRNCFEYYGNRSFPVEDGSEIYCCWCGEGGDLFCCSSCPKTVCKKCVKQNFGLLKLKEIEDNDDWNCFICKPEDIYPHRSIYWAWQHLTKKTRQNLITSPKLIKDLLLSKDTSHCCSDEPIELNLISLPKKLLMVKFPHSLIAPVHLSSVKNQSDKMEVVEIPVNRMGVNRGSLNNGDVSTVKMPVNRVTPQQIGPYKQPHFPACKRFRAPDQDPMGTMISQSPLMPYQQPMTHQQSMMLPSHQQKMMHPSHQQKMMHPSHQQKMMHSSHQQKMMQPTSRPLQVNRSRPYPMPMPYRPPQPTRPKPNNILMTMLETNQLQDTQHPHHSNTLDINQPQTVDLVDEDSPPISCSNGLDISWLERGLVGIKDCINPIRSQLNQFNLAREELRSDFSNLSNYVDKLAYNVKIAICQLAKINTNLQDAKKNALDNQVASVVSQLSDLTKKTGAVEITRRSSSDAPLSVEVTAVSSKVPQSSQPAPATPSTSKDEEITLDPALLCETVIESEIKKVEVKGGDDIEKTSTKQDTLVKKKPGRPRNSTNFATIRKQVMAKMKNRSPDVINLIDDGERMTAREFNAEVYCKKFKIKPSKVVLKRCGR